MKTSQILRLAPIFIGMLSILSTTESTAQKLMAVSENLLHDGHKYEVKYKGISTFPKYHFHHYNVASGKTGWMKSKYKSGFFSRMEEASSEYKGSYIFVSSKGDSAWVNFNRNADYKGLQSRGIVIETPAIDFGIGSAAEVLESKDNYTAVIETNGSENTWRLIVAQKAGSKIQSSFFGWLTDGDRRIDIKAVFDYQVPGKKGAVDLMMGGLIWHKGFEFFEDARSIGAVQLGPSNKQMVIWLANDIDPFTEFIVSASSVGLLRDYMVTMD